MKIVQRPLFFLLWFTKLAISTATDGPLPTTVPTNIPTCARYGKCLENAASAYCSHDQMIGCVCERQAFEYLISVNDCAKDLCSQADLNKVLNLILQDCYAHGYKIVSKTQTALVTPTWSSSLPIPGVTISTSIPVLTILIFTTKLESNPSASGVSSYPDSPNTSIPVLTILIFTTKLESNPSASGVSSYPDSSNTSTPSSVSSNSNSLSTAAIIGIVVGGIVVIAIFAGLIVFCMKHRAKQQRLKAMTAVPPAAAAGAGPPPPPMSTYPIPLPPRGYAPYGMDVYPPQKRPLIQGYHELEQPSSLTPTTTIATPAQEQYFQELPAQQRPIQVGPGYTQQDQVSVEMPSDNRRR